MNHFLPVGRQQRDLPRVPFCGESGWSLARSFPPCLLKRQRRKCHVHNFIFSCQVPSPPGCLLPRPRRTAWPAWKASGLKNRAGMHLPSEPLSTQWRPQLCWTPFLPMARRGRPRTDDFLRLHSKPRPEIVFHTLKTGSFFLPLFPKPHMVRCL